MARVKVDKEGIMTRPDNIHYDCGHTGHTVLPEQYDGQLVCTAELRADKGLYFSPWLCDPCWEQWRNKPKSQ